VRAAICPKNVCIPVRFISLDTEGVGVLKGVGKLSVSGGSRVLSSVWRVGRVRHKVSGHRWETARGRVVAHSRGGKGPSEKNACNRGGKGRVVGWERGSAESQGMGGTSWGEFIVFIEG